LRRPTYGYELEQQCYILECLALLSVHCLKLPLVAALLLTLQYMASEQQIQQAPSVQKVTSAFACHNVMLLNYRHVLTFILYYNVICLSCIVQKHLRASACNRNLLLPLYTHTTLLLLCVTATAASTSCDIYSAEADPFHSSLLPLALLSSSKPLLLSVLLSLSIVNLLLLLVPMLVSSYCFC
jgi:hypothetical protein